MAPRVKLERRSQSRLRDRHESRRGDRDSSWLFCGRTDCARTSTCHALQALRGV